MDKYIGELIADYLLKNEEDPVLHPDLEEWLAAGSSNQTMFEEYKKIWQEISCCASPVAFDLTQAWETIDRANRKKQKQYRTLLNLGYVAAGIAASVLLVLSLFSVGYLERPAPLVEVNTFTGNGNRSEIVLPDGTLVKLNTGTTLHYAFDRKKKTREVRFEGEAFFEVAKNKNPFIIHTPDLLDIEVLGTTFSISAYPDDDTFLVSLLEGSVDVGNPSGKLTMSPGEIVSYNRTTQEMTRLDKDISHMYGWMDNKLYMENMSLAAVCKKLERWYDVRITLAPGIGQSAHYTGVLQEDNIMDVLNALCSLSKIKYEMNGRQISITPK